MLVYKSTSQKIRSNIDNQCKNCCPMTSKLCDIRVLLLKAWILLLAITFLLDALRRMQFILYRTVLKFQKHCSAVNLFPAVNLHTSQSFSSNADELDSCGHAM